jgi:hypothetical protein
MARTGKDLAVDLSQLMVIGRIDLPWLACIYAEMTHAIADSADDNSAFAAPGFRGSSHPSSDSANSSNASCAASALTAV